LSDMLIAVAWLPNASILLLSLLATSWPLLSVDNDEGEAADEKFLDAVLVSALAGEIGDPLPLYRNPARAHPVGAASTPRIDPRRKSYAKRAVINETATAKSSYKIGRRPEACECTARRVEP